MMILYKALVKEVWVQLWAFFYQQASKNVIDLMQSGLFFKKVLSGNYAPNILVGTIDTVIYKVTTSLHPNREGN